MNPNRLKLGNRHAIWLTPKEIQEISAHLSRDFGITRNLTDAKTRALAELNKQIKDIESELKK